MTEELPFGKEFKKFEDKVLFDISEIHFVHGRIIAGFGLLLFILGISMVSLLYIIIIIGVIALIIKNDIPFKFIQLAIITLITMLIMIYIECKNSELLGFIIILLSISLFIFLANYRSFANNILKYSVSDSKK